MDDGILLKFEYDGKTFYLKNKNNKINYYSVLNGIKYPIIDNSEKELFNFVLNSIIPSNDLLFITEYEYNNNSYQVYLDKKTRLHIIKPFYNETDFNYLNYLFNNQKEYVELINDLNKENENNKLIKRFIKFYYSTISVTLALSFFTNLPKITRFINHDIISNIYLSAQESTYESSYANINDNDIRNMLTIALNENKNLSKEEVKMILPCIDAVIDNKKYANIDYLYFIFQNLKIEYKEEQKDNLTGSYNSYRNSIIFYKVNSLEEVPDYVFYHELSHVLSYYHIDYNSLIAEQTNCIFNESYFDVEDEWYTTHFTNYAAVFCRILGSETLKKYHNEASDRIIINELTKIINDKDKALRLLDLIDIYYKVGIENKKSSIVESIEEKILKEKIKKEFDDYYYAKYNMSIDNDLLMLYYFDYNEFENKIKQIYYKEEDNICIAKVEDKISFKTNYSDESILSVFMSIPENVPYQIDGKTYYRTIYNEDKTIYITDENRYIKEVLDTKLNR